MHEKLRVVLYTKPGCGLCEKMKQEMQRAGIEPLYTLEEVNIKSESDLYLKYRYDIPVLFINGTEAFRHRLTADEFKAAVTSLSTAG